MRFGTFIPQGWRHDLVGIEPADQWRVMRTLAQRADEATHEAWTLMSAFAAVTDRIRLGQMCTCMAYRNPAYLAKVAATVDHVSGGRLEMGIGAGWYEHEWRAYGYGFPEVRDRMGMFREACEIIHRMWTEDYPKFEGKYYTIDG